ncbi:MAG: hypothetical protein CL691_06075 [Cellvibrionales bacterium]|nr:hypothetical protein [Cellvibrionales bacterium]|tara:strand:- start:18085 stop:18897 length:813 start_codon:yes stop_codon:yes gene_type:complete
MKGPYPLKLHFQSSLAMFVHEKTDIHISEQIIQNGIWESYETSILEALLFPGATFIDVGANIGYYSLIGAMLVGDNGRVVAFEPEQDNFSLLEKNLSFNKINNVVAVNAGLSVDQRQGRLYLNEENRGDHQIYRQDDSAAPRNEQAINLVAGNHFLSQQLSPPVRQIDVLKIDTQGAELLVLSGLMPLLKSSLPQLKMIIEFTPYSLKQAGASGMALLDLVNELDLPMQLIDHLGRQLRPISRLEMQQWIAQTDAAAGNQGFINLLVGHD